MAREIVHEIKLRHPIEFGDRQIDVLKFRQMTAGDLRGISIRIIDGVPVFPHDDVIRLTSRLTGLPTGVIELLQPGDYAEVLGYSGPLLFGGPLNGGPSSPA